MSTQRAVNKLLKAGTQGVVQRKWWERQEDEKKEDEEEEDSDQKWTHMEHHGVIFAPDYVPHGIKPKIKGEHMELEIAQ